MDFTLISGLVSGLKGAYDLGQAALSVRDSNKFALTISQINGQLFQAQQTLFTVSSQAYAMHQQLMEAQEENRKLKAAGQERENYALVELAQGCFALKSKVTEASLSKETAAQPLHYVCQPCFDTGRKVVLQRNSVMGVECGLVCPVCRVQVFN